jgi:hypothetical protein
VLKNVRNRFFEKLRIKTEQVFYNCSGIQIEEKGEVLGPAAHGQRRDGPMPGIR